MKKAFSIILAVLMMLSVGIVNISGETTDIDIPVQVTYTVRENTAPKIVGADDVAILKGTSLDLLEGVRVEDPDEEDKNLSIDFGPTIDFSKAEVGVYEVHYQVEDNECASDHVVRKITVVNSNVYLDEDSPVGDAKVSVDNVVLLIDGITTDNSTLTQQQIEDIKNGTSSAIVGLKVSDTLANSEDKLLIQDKVKQELSVENSEQIVFLNVELLCTVTDANGQTIDTKNITETNQEVTVSVQMPEELINKDENVKREYSVARVHYSENGPETTILKAEYDPETGMLSFKTNKFSLYAIVYKDINVDPEITFIPSKKKPVVNTEGTMVSVSSLDLRPKTNNGSFNLRINKDDLYGKTAFVSIDDAVLTSEEGNIVTIKANCEQPTIIDGGEYKISFNVVDENRKPGVYTGEIIVKVSFKTGEALVNDVVYSSLQDAIDNAQDSQIVYLLKDIKISNPTDSENFISINKSLALDGRGYSIYCDDENMNDNARLVNISGISDANIIIKSITIESENYGSYMRGLNLFQLNNVNLTIENSTIQIPHYYALNIGIQCENLSISLDRTSIIGWATVYNHSSNVKLVANKCSFDSTNPTLSGGETNSFGNVVVCEYYDWKGSGDSNNNEFTFNECDFTADKLYPTSDVNQVVFDVRSPYNNTLEINNCSFSRLATPAYIKVCYDTEYESDEEKRERMKGTNKLVINGELIDCESADYVDYYLDE